MKALLAGVAIAIVVSANPEATAQSYPTKPVTVVVPFSAGGPTDTFARIMGEHMRKALGQPILIDNTTGAGGTIGTGKVARSAPDGYMVSIGHWGTHVVNGAYYTNLPFNLLTDFEHAGMIASNPQLIISRNTLPTNNFKELLAWISANQGKVLMGTGGVGGASHMAGIYFQNLINTKFEYIAYRGGAPALQALMGNQVDLFVTQVGSAINMVRAGKVRAYAVTSKNRQAAAPEIPTVDEAGLPGFHTSVWHAYWLPKGTPKDIVAKFNASLVDSLADPAVRKRLVDLGQEIPTRDQQTPEAHAAHHKAEIEKWWPIIKASGLKADL